MGRTVGIVPGETTLTDNALLQLAVSHRAEISIQRFTSRGEAENGADWEWWIRDRNGYLGFRVQAKRAHPDTGRVALDQRAARSVSSGTQIKMFADKCAADNIAGLYCVYSDRRPTARPNLAKAGPCPHGPVDDAQWGCTMVLSGTAQRLAARKQFTAENVLAAGLPWYHLVCHHSVIGMTVGMRQVFETLRAADDAISGSGRTAGRRRRSAGPPPAVTPPAQVEAYFRRDIRTLEPWSDLAGAVLIDASGDGYGF